MPRGDVLLINLPASDGREQSGRCPVIAVQTDIAGEPMLMVAPITSNLNASRFAFTVPIEPSVENGLTQTSVEDMKRVDAEIWRMLKPTDEE